MNSEITPPQSTQNNGHQLQSGESAAPSDKKRNSLIVFGLNILTGCSSNKTVSSVQKLSSVVVCEHSQQPKPPSFLRRHALFIACVVLPTLLAIAYFGFYASDIYVSEAAYIVRSPNKQTTASGLGAMLQGAGFSGFSRAQDDVYTVSEYVASRDAMNFLNEKLNLEESWSSGKINIFNRFDPIGWDSSNEALYEYYLQRVTVAVDAVSGITTLSASVFNPEQAYDIIKTLLTKAEELVNLLNERGRNDLIRFAENEVRIAEDRAKAAANAVSNYRNTQAVVDPEKQTQLHYEHISRLQEELVKTRAQLTQLKVFAPKSPHPPALELREKTIENEIQKEMEKITGGENSLASKAAEFERLALEREFADRQLAGALTSLEAARNEAQRQQLYLETISKPNLPDEAILPKRIRGILTVLVLGMLSWGILSMFLAGIREHHY
jgi:capsular polysaccharide transport system permease protein